MPIFPRIPQGVCEKSPSSCRLCSRAGNAHGQCFSNHSTREVCPIASAPTFIEDSGKNSSLWERSAATASLSLERGRKWRDTFPQSRKSKKHAGYPLKWCPEALDKFFGNLYQNCSTAQRQEKHWKRTDHSLLLFLAEHFLCVIYFL